VIPTQGHVHSCLIRISLAEIRNLGDTDSFIQLGDLGSTGASEQVLLLGRTQAIAVGDNKVVRDSLSSVSCSIGHVTAPMGSLWLAQNDSTPDSC
jgi:hypothetical protein